MHSITVSPGLPDYSTGAKPVQPCKHGPPWPQYKLLIIITAPGDVITMHKTKNNLNDGTYTDDGGDVTFNVGDRLGSGSKGAVYDINCGGRSACQSLGNVVLKFYIDTSVIEDERKNLAKIDELKAVIKTENNGPLTLLTKWEGLNFSKLPTWEKLSQANPQDKPAMNAFVDDAINKITSNAQDYIRNHKIYHLYVLVDAHIPTQEANYISGTLPMPTPC